MQGPKFKEKLRFEISKDGIHKINVTLNEGVMAELVEELGSPDASRVNMFVETESGTEPRPLDPYAELLIHRLIVDREDLYEVEFNASNMAEELTELCRERSSLKQRVKDLLNQLFEEGHENRRIPILLSAISDCEKLSDEIDDAVMTAR